jgi:hypothetical protein
MQLSGIARVAAGALAGGLCVAAAAGCGRHEGPGTIEGKRLPAAAVAERAEAETTAARALGVEPGPQTPADQATSTYTPPSRPTPS